MWKITADNVEIYNNDGLKIFDLNEAKRRKEIVEKITMSELTTGGINFGYQSPIYRIVGDITTQIIQDGENQIFQAIQKSDVVVDKPELIKALQYDRNQYDKGYSDGRASIVEEFEKLKSKIKKAWEEENGLLLEEVLYFIDKNISELKGEQRMNKEEIIKGLKIATRKIGGCYDNGGWLDNEEVLARKSCEEAIELLEQEPCEDAISRNEALSEFRPRGIAEDVWKESYVYKKLTALPPITPQPKIGRWILNEKGQSVQCSECHIPQYVFSPYCPYCGAKMVQEEEE